MADLKLNYSLESRLEVFYTGGCVRMSADESRTACACHDEVKVRLTFIISLFFIISYMWSRYNHHDIYRFFQPCMYAFADY